MLTPLIHPPAALVNTSPADETSSQAGLMKRLATLEHVVHGATTTTVPPASTTSTVTTGSPRLVMGRKQDYNPAMRSSGTSALYAQHTL